VLLTGQPEQAIAVTQDSTVIYAKSKVISEKAEWLLVSMAAATCNCELWLGFRPQVSPSPMGPGQGPPINKMCHWTPRVYLQTPRLYSDCNRSFSWGQHPPNLHFPWGGRQVPHLTQYAIRLHKCVPCVEQFQHGALMCQTTDGRRQTTLRRNV